jgi:hypothetical protein
MQQQHRRRIFPVQDEPFAANHDTVRTQAPVAHGEIVHCTHVTGAENPARRGEH